MLNNKLIGLLQSFERREMTRFREFAFSPYFNKHEGVRALVKVEEDGQEKGPGVGCFHIFGF